MICPEYGRRLVKHSSKYEEFIEYSNYPTCKYAKNNNIIRRFQMSIINSFDNTTEEILKPNNIVNKIKNFPEVLILVFKDRFFEYLQKNYNLEIIGYLNTGLHFPIYKFNYNNKEFAITKTILGSSGSAAIIEELIAMGSKKILIFGTCGTLDKNILKGHFIIPTYAYRDEGTSYHYMKPSDFIKINTANNLSNIFDELNIPYITGKTWTTDALYRETAGNFKKRKEQGCIVVEMECSAIMAVSQFRKIPVYQFLYGSDTLDGTQWDKREVDSNSKESIEKNILNISLKIAEKL